MWNLHLAADAGKWWEGVECMEVAWGHWKRRFGLRDCFVWWHDGNYFGMRVLEAKVQHVKQVKLRVPYFRL